jgi:subtilisin family serine protease
MKRLLVAVALVLGAFPVRADDVRRPYLVATENDAVVLPAGAIRFRTVDGSAVELTEDEASALARRPGVRYVEPDMERFVSTVAAPPHLDQKQVPPWGIAQVKVASMWFLTRGEGVRVGIIDTGYDIAHGDLQAAYRGGWDFVHNDAVPDEEAQGDARGHGTRMAGAIAATDNGIGVIGVAPGVSLYALKVFPRSGGALTSNIIRALDWAIAQRLDVLSCSFGSNTPTRLEEEAFNRARDANIIVIAAVGNDGSIVNYPAAYPSVVGVGATDRVQRVAAFSNRGAEVEFVAPGVDLISTFITGEGRIGSVTLDDSTVLSAHPFFDSTQGEAVGAAVDCGRGREGDFPPDTAHNVAIMQRDGGAILDKLSKAVAARASGLIMINNRADDMPLRAGPGDATLLPVAVSISAQSARVLRAHGGQLLLDAYVTDYDAADGTSLSAPYVAAIAALVRSLRPDLSVEGVLDILRATATDLGEKGRDESSGYGLIDAYAAAAAAVPERFPAKRRRRSVGH